MTEQEQQKALEALTDHLDDLCRGACFSHYWDGAEYDAWAYLTGELAIQPMDPEDYRGAIENLRQDVERYRAWITQEAGRLPAVPRPRASVSVSLGGEDVMELVSLDEWLWLYRQKREREKRRAAEYDSQHEREP